MIRYIALASAIVVSALGTASASEIGDALARCISEGITAGNILVSIPQDSSQPDTAAVIMCEHAAASILFNAMHLVAEQSPGIEATSRRAGKGIWCTRNSKSGGTTCIVTIETNAAFVDALTR